MKIQKSDSLEGLFSSNIPSGSYKDHVPELKKDIKKESKKDDSWRNVENQRAMRKSVDGTLDANRVLNAGNGGEKSESQSMNFLGSHRANSIWNSKKLQDIAKVADSQEKIAQEKADIAKVRAGWKQENLDELAENVKKHALNDGVAPMSVQDGSEGKRTLPQNNISIFDSDAFERIPEKTAGEKLKDKPEKGQDDTWKSAANSKAQSTTDSTDLFNNLLSRMNQKDGE